MFGLRGTPERIIDGGSREAFQSFVPNQRVLAAINIVSIHTKLDLEGVDDRRRKGAARAAKKPLPLFLRNWGKQLTKLNKGNRCLV